MAGLNRFEEVYKAVRQKSFEGWSQEEPCVFISHRKSDTKAAKAVASYLKSLYIDIYLDEYDSLLSSAVADGNSELIVGYIELGIASSTHLLGVISPNTKGSWWVPFEIGSARQKELSIAYLLLDEVNDLPEYLRITKHIKTRFELSVWILKEFNQEGDLIIRKSFDFLPNIPGLPDLFPSASVRFVKST